VNEQLLLDPVPHEAAQQQGSLLVAYSLAANQVTQMQLTGTWSAAQVREGLELAMGGCQQLRGVLRQTLLEAAMGPAANEG
jgi:exosome complex component MTR3